MERYTYYLDRLAGKRYVGTGVVCSRLGISRQTLSNWRARGKGPPCIKIGNHHRYDIEALEEFERTHELLEAKAWSGYPLKQWRRRGSSG